MSGGNVNWEEAETEEAKYVYHIILLEKLLACTFRFLNFVLLGESASNKLLLLFSRAKKQFCSQVSGISRVRIWKADLESSSSL